MALKHLMYSKQIELKRAELTALNEKEEDLRIRSEAAEATIGEVKTDEELNVAMEEVEKIESEKASLNEQKSMLDGEIQDLESKLEDLEQKSKQIKNTKEGKQLTTIRNVLSEERQERLDYVQRNKEFFERVANIMLRKEKRAVSGSELMITEEVMGVIRTKIPKYSQLYSLVHVRLMGGKGRAIIPGEIPEGVWTEMCAKINELDIDFSDIEVDGWKVAGFIKMCNAILEDASYLNLASEIEYSISMAIAKALDKAVIYGTGTKMPEGIVHRLARTTANSGENNFVDYSTTNILKITGAKLSDLISKTAAIKSKNELTVVMNRKTWLGDILPQTLLPNSGGSYVVASGQVLPGIGNVVFSDLMPVNNVLIGDFAQYLLAERAGLSLAVSTEYLFLDDETVFRGTARYDGKPIVPNAFVLIGINNIDATTSVTFASDTANAVTPEP